LRGSYRQEVRYRDRFTPTTGHVAAAAVVSGVLAIVLGGLGSVIGAAVLGVLTLTIAARREAVAEQLESGPAVDVIEHERPGLTAKEAEEFYTLHQEYLQMQEEKREEMRQEAKQNGSSSGRTLNKQ